MLKNLGIDLHQSEKKTLYSFLSLYTFLCLVIIFFVSFLYFTFQKDLMLQNKREVLQAYSKDFILRLKDLHINFDKYKYYPRDEKFNSAIYDSEQTLIFSTLEAKNVSLNEVIYTNTSHIHFIEEPESYYLGAKYIVIEIIDKNDWFFSVKKEIALFSSIAFIFMFLMGFFLLRLFLKPMRDSFFLLDNFIKDTTHELNTPLMVITSNVEMLKNHSFDEKIQKKINRIEIAARTVSNIYDDLTYLTLNNKIISKNENINLSILFLQRIEYFKSLSKSKKITMHSQINKDIFIYCDNKKISEIIDNLISNAIKYNKIKGSIHFILKESYLCIEDTGIGIKEEDIKYLFQRYSRFSYQVGGFGIGLNIVKLICDEYDINITASSLIKKGTKMELRW